MSVEELKLAEEKYNAYMDGQKKRMWPLDIEFKINHTRMKDAIDSLRYAIERLSDVRVPKFDQGGFLDHTRILIAGSSYGKTAMLEAMMKDLYNHGVSFSIAKERDGEIEHTLLPFDSLTNKLSFDARMLADWADLAGSLPEKGDKERVEEPKNWLEPEPPKQKKFRSCRPNKRVINRKNRKKK